MPDYRVVWNLPESSDVREQEVIVRGQASPEHAAWEGFRQVLDTVHPSGQALIRVEELPAD